VSVYYADTPAVSFDDRLLKAAEEAGLDIASPRD